MNEYKIYKSQFYGWKADTQVELGNNKVLTITTMKRSNGSLATIASVGIQEGMFISHFMFTDYNKTIDVTYPKKVTQKAVETQHLDIVIEDVIQDAIGFYK